MNCKKLSCKVPCDLSNKGTGQHNGDEFHKGKDNPNHCITNHHWNNIIFQLILEHCQASVDKDLVEDLFGTVLEDVVAAVEGDRVAAGVRN